MRNLHEKLLELIRPDILSLGLDSVSMPDGWDMYVRSQESRDRRTEGVGGSRTLVWMYNRSVRVLPLPVLAAMNGHTAFVQELHIRLCQSARQQTIT